MSKLQSRQRSVDWKQLLDKPRVYVDLNSGGKVGDSYFAPLDAQDTTPFREGMTLDLWTDDGDEDGNPDPLVFTGIVHFDTDLNQWVAVIPDDNFRNSADILTKKDTVNIV